MTFLVFLIKWMIKYVFIYVQMCRKSIILLVPKPLGASSIRIVPMAIHVPFQHDQCFPNLRTLYSTAIWNTFNNFEKNITLQLIFSMFYQYPKYLKNIYCLRCCSYWISISIKCYWNNYTMRYLSVVTVCKGCPLKRHIFLALRKSLHQ